MDVYADEPPADDTRDFLLTLLDFRYDPARLRTPETEEAAGDDGETDDEPE